MQDYRRNGWYALGGALIAVGAGWLANWGNTVASAKKDSATHFLIPATYVAVAGCAVGFLIILAVMFNWSSTLWRHVKQHKEPGQQPPDESEGSASRVPSPQQNAEGTVSLRDFTMGGDSKFKLKSSADILAERARLSGRAKLDAEHFPGRPELLGREVGSQDE